MSSLQPVSKSRHQNKRWKRPTNFSHARLSQFAPLLFSELSTAAASFPIGFIADGEGFSFGALLGVEANCNLWVDGYSGQWTGNYVPLTFQAFPFSRAKDQSDTPILCIDESSGAISYESTDHPFFDEDGEPGKELKEIMALLSQLEEGLSQSRHLCETLKDLGLLVPWPLTFKVDNTEIPVGGLYRIDEQAMHQLESDDIIKLHESRAVAVAYAHLLSLAHIQTLGQRYVEKLKKNAEKATGPLNLAGDAGGISASDFL